mmetsp:Transcript_13988/g.33855  ORF Transcript_13988/g.33855 Transcript_13988/m.33855 type:complete len:80 (+) Transcript_13988:452-691(+)
MRFASKYIRRAYVQGHVKAIPRMVALRSCVLCGAEDAPFSLGVLPVLPSQILRLCVLGGALVRRWQCRERSERMGQFAA